MISCTLASSDDGAAYLECFHSRTSVARITPRVALSLRHGNVSFGCSCRSMAMSRSPGQSPTAEFGEELHRHFNERLRATALCLYARELYTTMQTGTAMTTPNPRAGRVATE